MTTYASIRLVFMLEEESAKHFLNALLPNMLPPCVEFLCIAHQGKDDLQKSLPIKLKKWRNPSDFFVILHDQDDWDCVILKKKLRNLCKVVQSHSPLIRIVCRELEAWYFGDLDAVKKAFPQFRIALHRNKTKFRIPDSIPKPSEELKKIIKGFSKIRAAREIPKHMKPTANKSTSFNAMQSGVRKFATAHLRARKA